MINSRLQTLTPSVMANAATSAATPMITPVVESTVRSGLIRNASTAARAASRRAVRSIPPGTDSSALLLLRSAREVSNHAESRSGRRNVLQRWRNFADQFVEKGRQVGPQSSG